MSLENLLKIGQLKSHPPDAREIGQLLVAARRNIRDARVTSISAETRFDVAYKAIMQSAMAALMMHGYRPDTNRPGHHMTAVQSLPLTIGIDSNASWCSTLCAVSGMWLITPAMMSMNRRQSTASLKPSSWSMT